jgi:hypothetical protein
VDTAEYILIFIGFARTPGWCHVVVEGNGNGTVLVGELDDNPGTSVLNATEEIASAISHKIFNGAAPSDFTLFEYEVKAPPDLKPTFYRVAWNGAPGQFSMPTWTVVDPSVEPGLRSVQGSVRADDYTFDAVTSERELELIDAREPERVVARAKTRTVGAEEFRQRLDPTVEFLRQFTATVDLIADRGAAVDSQAVREIAAEAEMRARSDWENPIGDTHTFGAMALRVATDNARTFAQALNAEQAPVYAHLVVARAALEASVVSEWLNQPGIPYLERAKRGMCERLYSANQFRQLPIESGGEETFAQYEADAARFGWQLEFDAEGKPSVDGTTRPSIPAAITRLLTGSDEGRLGELVWDRLSAITHVVWWGLQGALFTDDPVGGAETRGGWRRVPIGTESQNVATHALFIVRSLRLAATARFMLMGRTEDTEWQLANREAEEHEGRLRRELSSGDSS